MKQDLEQNKKNAIDFYRMSYEGNPRGAVDLYVGKEYIQHNPLVGDGVEPFIEYFERMATEYKDQAVVAKVNVYDVPELAEKYGISSIPAVILFSNGQEAERIVGYNSEQTYANAIDNLSS